LRITAAVVDKVDGPFVIEDVDLDEPLRMQAAQ